MPRFLPGPDLSGPGRWIEDKFRGGSRRAVRNARKGARKAWQGPRQPEYDRGGRTRPPKRENHDRPRAHAGQPIKRAQPRERIKNMQAFLKSRGYNIDADGLMGQQTKSALSNWHRGVGERNPRAWSQRFNPIHQPDDDTTPVNDNNQRDTVVSSTRPVVRGKPRPATRHDANRVSPGTAVHQRAGADPPRVDMGKHGNPNKGKGTRKPMRGSAPGRLATSMFDPGPLGQWANMDLIDPDEFARSQAQYEFGPQIGEILRQEGRTQAEGKAHMEDLTHWFSELGDKVAARGGSSNMPGFGADLANAYAMQGQQELMNQDKRTRNAMTELEDRKFLATQQMGAATAKARQEGMLQRTQQKQANVGMWEDVREGNLSIWDTMERNNIARGNLDLAVSASGMDRTRLMDDILNNKTNRQATAAQIWATYNPGLANPQAQPTPLDIKQQQAQIDATNRSNRPSPGKPGDKRKERSDVLRTMYDSTRTEGGKWRVNQTMAWKRAKSTLSTMGIDPGSKQGKQYLQWYANQNGIVLGKRGNPVRTVGRKRPKRR